MAGSFNCELLHSSSQYINYIMARIHNTGILLSLLTVLTTASYLQFALIRTALNKKQYQRAPITCKNKTALNGDAQYHQICFQKDISYNIPFICNQNHFYMAVDLTIPIGWVKSTQCKVQGANRKCHRKVQTIAEQVRAVKKKIAGRLHKKQAALKQDAIIQGSSYIIRGEVQRSRSISFIATDSNRLNNFLQLVLLGLYIYGQKDHLELISTNFINATEISEQLDVLCDGAISLRFDQFSENSFLNEIFNYVRAAQKTVTIYLGLNNTITIGDITAKYIQNGYSAIQWIDMIEDQGFGKLPRVMDIGLENSDEQTQSVLAQQITAVFTLSASYIGLPQTALKSMLDKLTTKQIKCLVNDKTQFMQCTALNKKAMQKLKQQSIFFSFRDNNINVRLQKLVLEQHSKKITLNIKKSFNNRIILGEPIFLQYFIAFDYSSHKIGFAQKRTTFDQPLIDIVMLTRLLCLSCIIGCMIVFFSHPCQYLFKFGYNKEWRITQPDLQGRRLRQYSPIQQNPYDDLKGKIQQAIGTQKEVQGI